MDELSLQWTPAHGPMRKFVFKPQSEGEYPWARIEFELCESQWQEVGIEYLDKVSFVSDDSEGSVPSCVQTYLEEGDIDE